MKINYYFLLFSIFLLIVGSCNEKKVAVKPIQFEPTWESLGQYKVPDWFRDAKFGIYTHWGPPSTIKGNSGWYGRHMYIQHIETKPEGYGWGDDYNIHNTNYGHPSEFGYKDIIPNWKAEHWNPDTLMKLFKKAGAKYFAAMAVHHDNFDNYDSSFQPWNSVNMGPKRDIVGEWKSAAAQEGLRFGVTSHSDRTWRWFSYAFGADDNTGLKPGVFYDGHLTKADGKGTWWEGYDPADLYTTPHATNAPITKAYAEQWFNRTKELIDKYSPDLIYFDSPIPIVDTNSEWGENDRPIHEQYGLDIAAHFYNTNQAKHQGNLEAVLNIKEWNEKSVVDKSAVVMDVEKGGVSSIQKHPWQTDTSLADGWYWNGDETPSLQDTVVVHNLCDIVSKNGNMLLNVGLRGDGTLPEKEEDILKSVGQWLAVNGEAIYGTRPWVISEEGPSKLEEGHFKENKKPLTAKDIRFTAKEKVMYAIVLGWPVNGSITIKSLKENNTFQTNTIRKVSMLGSSSKLKWKQTTNGLEVIFPKEKPCNFAYAIKIE